MTTLPQLTVGTEGPTTVWHRNPDYARTQGAERLALKAAMNIVAMPSHWITAINVWVNAVTREEP